LGGVGDEEQGEVCGGHVDCEEQTKQERLLAGDGVDSLFTYQRPQLSKNGTAQSPKPYQNACMCELMFNRTAIFIELNIGLVRAIEEFL
jgi:hypothetical protein